MSNKFAATGTDAVTTQNQVAHWLNEAGLADGGRKADNLRKAIEVLVHHSAAAPLLEAHIDTVLSYVNDKNTEVKKLVTGFIEEISKVHPQYIPQVVGQLRLLIGDSVVAVVKRAIQAASIVYRHSLAWFCRTPPTYDTKIAWQHLSELKLIILNMIDNDNEGIRTHSIKFLEEVVLLQSAGGPDEPFQLEALPAFVDKPALREEAEQIFELLVKFHNSAHISSVNLMACMTTLVGVSRARPAFLPRVLRALQLLHATLPPTLSASQVNSVRKHLRMLLLSLIKHPSSTELVPQLIQLLSDTGMTQQEINKAIPRERRSKRLADIKNGDAPTKRLRLDSPHGSQGSDSNSRGEFTTIDEDSEPLPPPVQEVPVTMEDSLLNGIDNVENVVNLVTSTLLNKLPEEMPEDFSTSYAPIPNAGSKAQKRSLAKMIAALVSKTEVPSEPVKVPEPVPPPEDIPLLKEDDEKITLKNAVAKLQESTKAERAIESAVGRLLEEARADHLKQEGDEPRAPVPPTPTVPKLKQKVKLLKLAEITRPIPKEVKERLIVGAVRRILDAEQSCGGSASAVRDKFLTLFASGYGAELRDLILKHILAAPETRLDLALHWLYEEYAYMQGFARHPALRASSAHEKHDHSYSRLLCELAASLLHRAHAPDETQSNLVRRLYLECPLVTSEAAELLRVSAAELPTLALELLRELALTRPPAAHKLAPHILPHTLSDDESTRELAISICASLHAHAKDNPPYAKLRATIEKHALLQLGFVALPSPPQELTAARARQPWDDRLYKICMALIIAIFPDNEELIVEIGRVYGNAESEAKRVLVRMLEPVIRTALSKGREGGLPRAAVALLDECPRGADTLLTRVVHMLTERAPPSVELVRRVRELYATRVHDVRFLIPVLTGLSKSEILAAMPKLIKLNPAVVKEVFNKLLGLNASYSDHQSPVSPTDLLVALHLIDPAQADLKYIIKATAICFAEKQVYTQDVVGAVLQALSEQSTVPVLMLRSVLQALALYPALQPMVLDVLQLLIEKEVWSNKVSWEGWVKCVERLLPRARRLLAALPPRAAALLPPALAAYSAHAPLGDRATDTPPGYNVQDQPGPFPVEPLPPGMD